MSPESNTAAFGMYGTRITVAMVPLSISIGEIFTPGCDQRLLFFILIIASLAVVLHDYGQIKKLFPVEEED